MVIPTVGAINAFLAIYAALPLSIKSFIATSLFILGGVKLLQKVIEL